MGLFLKMNDLLNLKFFFFKQEEEEEIKLEINVLKKVIYHLN